MSRIITSRVTGISQVPENFSGYLPINVLSWHKKDSEYYQLSPYHLRTDGHEEGVNPGNVIFENFWQGQKVYPRVSPIEVYCHPSKQGDPRFLWYKSTRNEKHLDEQGNVLPGYWGWKKELFECQKPVRYPVGFAGRHECCFLLLEKKDGTSERLDYLTARREVYAKEYKRLARKLPIYQKLLSSLRENPELKICISEIDVPCSTKKGQYNCQEPFFECTLASLEELLLDPSEAFGHGLCFAQALLEDLS